MPELCDFCGRKGATKIALIAGTKGFACDQCASLGRVEDEILEIPKHIVKQQEERERKPSSKIEIVQEVTDEVGELVRKKRESIGLKQEELAKKISEHESMVKRIEHGYVPSVKIARKLERVLGISLIETSKVSDEDYDSGTSGGALTLGDIVVVRK